MSTSDEIGHHLLAEARRADVQFGAMLSWYVAERFAQRLERSGQRESLLLYGDLLLHAVDPGGMPRVWSAELMRRAGPDAKELAHALADVASVDGADGLVFEPAVELCTTWNGGQTHLPHEARVTARLGGSRCKIRVWVGDDLAPEVKPWDLSYPRVLKETGATRPMACAPEVFAADLVSQLARSGVTHMHPKAYDDLRRLFGVKEFRVEVAARAIAAHFRHFGTALPIDVPLAFGPKAAADKTLNRMWTAYCLRARHAAVELSHVVQELRNRLLPLLEQARREFSASH
jgi:hypothetical protein